MYFRYTGDSTGSSLTSGEEYRKVEKSYSSPDYVYIEHLDTDELFKMTRDEWQMYRSMGSIEILR
jgi:hypothetical protein